MSVWLSATCSGLFSAAVPAAFVFSLLDLVVSCGFRIAFLGRPAAVVRGGRLNG